MDTQTKQDQHRSAEEKLSALGRRIDDVRGNGRGDREKVDRSI